MIIQKCEDKNNWDKFILGQESAEFLQSWQWGDFQERTGKQVLRLQLVEDGKVLGQVQGFEQSLAPFIKFIYLPKISCRPDFLNYLEQSGYFFARIEPTAEIKAPDKFQVFSVLNRQPKDTWVLDIAGEEEMLAGMHQKTRYNIKLAEKKGVVVKEEKNAEIFWRLNEETFARDRFKSHDRDYYEKMLQMDMCHQLTAYFEGEAIASNILVNFGGTMTYLHGASSNKYRNLMAPYLLQWEGIKLARGLGAIKYDFGGISPKRQIGETKTLTDYHNYSWDAAHKWTGITRFKVGFGGRPLSYPQAIEVALKPFLYKLFRLIKK